MLTRSAVLAATSAATLSLGLAAAAADHGPLTEWEALELSELSSTPGEMEDYEDWHATLERGRLGAKINPPTRHDWGDVTINNVSYDFIGPSSRQAGSGCWLYSDVHMLQINAAYNAFHAGYTPDPSGDLGIWLNPLSWWDCADLGTGAQNLGEVFDYTADRWRHQGWGEHYGYVENCIDPVVSGAQGWPTPETCGVCDRYRDIVDPDERPLWSDCSWIQGAHPDDELLFRHEPAMAVDLSAAVDPTQVPAVDFDEFLQIFGEILYLHGPINVTTYNLWSHTGINDVWTCNNPDGHAVNHHVAVVAYDMADPDYNGQPTITIQNSGTHGTKNLYKLDFEAFVTPTANGGCGLGWTSHYFPTFGAKTPYPLSRTNPPVTDPPLRCDLDGDLVDGFEDVFLVDNCPEVYNPTQSGGCDACQPGASPADDADGDGVGDVCLWDTTPTDCDLAGDGTVSLPRALALIALSGLAVLRRRSA
jgi:hypothetical protein